MAGKAHFGRYNVPSIKTSGTINGLHKQTPYSASRPIRNVSKKFVEDSTLKSKRKKKLLESQTYHPKQRKAIFEMTYNTEVFFEPSKEDDCSVYRPNLELPLDGIYNSYNNVENGGSDAPLADPIVNERHVEDIVTYNLSPSHDFNSQSDSIYGVDNSAIEGNIMDPDKDFNVIKNEIQNYETYDLPNPHEHNSLSDTHINGLGNETSLPSGYPNGISQCYQNYESYCNSNPQVNDPFPIDYRSIGPHSTDGSNYLYPQEYGYNCPSRLTSNSKYANPVHFMPPDSSLYAHQFNAPMKRCSDTHGNLSVQSSAVPQNGAVTSLTCNFSQSSIQEKGINQMGNNLNFVTPLVPMIIEKPFVFLDVYYQRTSRVRIKIPLSLYKESNLCRIFLEPYEERTIKVPVLEPIFSKDW